MDDGSLVHDVGDVGHVDGERGVLLDEQDGRAFLAQLTNQSGHFGDQRGRQSLGRFVHDEQRRVGDQRSRNSEHLLFAAAQVVASVMASLREPGKERKDTIDVPVGA